MNSEYENNIVLSGGEYDLDKYNDSAHLVIKGDTVVNAINLHNNMHLFIKLDKNSSLVFNMFDYAVSLEVKIELEAYDGSTFTINSAFIAENKYDLTIETKLYGDDIYGTVNIRGVNEANGIVKVVMNGTVAGETHGNVLNEYAKVLNKSDQSNVLIPNLIVNTNDVEANHGVSIGSIRKDELSYLMSKGIKKSTAIKIIEEGFIKSGMPDEVQKTIQNILIGR